MDGHHEAEQMPQDYDHCFACGPENESGLQLLFLPQEDGSVRCETMLRNDFQGWHGLAHGGIVMMMLDEAMAYAAVANGHNAVTANVQIRFKKPTPLKQRLIITARILWQRRSVIGMTAEICGENGIPMAIAQGEFLSRGPSDLEKYKARIRNSTPVQQSSL
jgi:acyl-coenzyme A thioesterase PaaI-like protein